MLNSTKLKRSDKYELLRIVSAITIMLNHINVSFSPVVSSVGNVNKYVIQFFHLGGKFGVNIFVILGCYFLCNTEFKAKRIWRLIGEVIFYALLLNLADILIFKKDLTSIDFIHGFSYWFPFAYIVMLIFIPFINKFIIPRFQKFIVILGSVLSIVFVLWGYLAPNAIFKLITLEQIMGSLWFCYTYVLVGYLKENNIFDKTNYIKSAPIVFIICYFSMYIIVLATNNSVIRDMYSPLCFVSALCLFYMFHHLSDFSYGWIQALSGCTLGTYLLQCHNNTAYIWEKEIFKYSAFSDSILLIPLCIGSIILLYLLAWFINLIYKKIGRI